MRTGIIYISTSKSSGKSYIGQTTEPFNDRRNDHKSAAKQINRDHKIKFYNAINKYTFDDFNWDILLDNEESDTLDFLEVSAIYLYDTFYNGYNSTYGGNTTRGRKCSDETKLKISKANLGKSAWNKGTKCKKETLLKMKKITKEYFTDEKHREHSSKMKEKYEYRIIKPDGKEEIITNMKKYCENNDLIKSCMLRVAKGEYKQHKGYKCEKIKEL